MTELLDVFKQITAVPDEDPGEPYAWPQDGQQFEAVCVLASCDDSPQLTGDLPPALHNVLSDTGVGTAMTNDLFNHGEIPTEPGTYKMTIEYSSNAWIDWETGAEEVDYGFNVLAIEKINEKRHPGNLFMMLAFGYLLWSMLVDRLWPRRTGTQRKREPTC